MQTREEVLEEFTVRPFQNGRAGYAQVIEGMMADEIRMLRSTVATLELRAERPAEQLFTKALALNAELLKMAKERR